MIIDRQKLDLLLAEKQMTLVQLAEKAKTGKATLLKIRREENVQPITAGKVANALNVPIVILVKENGQKNKQVASDQR